MGTGGKGVTPEFLLSIKPRKRPNERSDRMRDTCVRFWERSECNGDGIHGGYGTRQIAFFSVANAPNRANAAKSGRPPRAPEEGALVPLGKPCAPHPPCIMPPRQTVHGSRIPHALPSPS